MGERACACLCVCVCARARARVCVCVCVRACVYACVRACVYACVRTHACVYVPSMALWMTAFIMRFMLGSHTSENSMCKLAVMSFSATMRCLRRTGCGMQRGPCAWAGKVRRCARRVRGRRRCTSGSGAQLLGAGQRHGRQREPRTPDAAAAVVL